MVFNRIFLPAKSGLNLKYINKDVKEVVFTSNDKMISYYPDKGTYNYCNGNIWTTLFGDHDKYDVKPFKILEKKDSNMSAIFAGILYPKVRFLV